ncbi:hypothetical protein [Sphingomonas rubra]|uniref:Flagellar motor protein MotB n=1 Tax=Sphingomonas rubra TaxID=634430 RepID=A0A1I5UJL8_9SPHN|nr:hypothetical protein [Sphingomonas rubra]SFP95418.1 hypothetical protein SAMN04488241_11221 [Sphingomonas rubra]
MNPSRPLWLVTLADLALLLVGFFVLLQVRGDHRALAQALHARFGDPASAEEAIPLAAERVAGFATGSATLPADPAQLRRWAAEQFRDPRVVLTVTGTVDGSAGDVDPLTRSGVLLAADRARAVAATIAPLSPSRVRVATATDPHAAMARAVTVTLGFAGERTSS